MHGCGDVYRRPRMLSLMAPLAVLNLSEVILKEFNHSIVELAVCKSDRTHAVNKQMSEIERPGSGVRVLENTRKTHKVHSYLLRITKLGNFRL